MLRAEASVDAGLAQGKHHWMTGSSPMIRKKDGARYHQLVATTSDEPELRSYYE